MRVYDPVCGMTLEAAEAAVSLEFEGQLHFFCALECKQAFEQDPRRFLDPEDDYAVDQAGEAIGAGSEEPALRNCVVAGHPARAFPGERTVGQITLEEFEAIARAEWRHRLGRRSYRRHHPRELIRALLMDALEPGNETLARAAQERLSEEIARLRVAGLSRVQIQRELYHLSHVVADVLRRTGVSVSQATKLAALMEQRLASRLEWQERWARIQDAWSVAG